MQNAESIGLNKDHMGIAKFERQDDWDFTTVTSRLSQMADVAPLKIANIWNSYKRETEEGRSTSNETRLSYPNSPGLSFRMAVQLLQQ